MSFKERNNTICDEKGRPLVRIVHFGGKRWLNRTPACTLGDYFAVLCWLMDQDDETTAE